MAKMTAHDFAVPMEGGMHSTGTRGGSANVVAARIRQLAQDVQDGKAIVSKIEVKSALSPDEIVQTALTITFIDLA